MYRFRSIGRAAAAGAFIALTSSGQALAQLHPAVGVAEATSAAVRGDSDRRVEEVRAIAGADEAHLISIFKQLHANPELGFMEHATSALVAKEFKALGYDVRTGVGQTGVVGVLRNGPGPVIMFRGDMDALPVKEETDLPYRSTKVIKDLDGVDTPAAHACGHDAHVAWLIGVAKVMSTMKKDWSGTLVLVAQPAEEPILGAAAMVDDGLYKFAPKPDVLFAAHVTSAIPVGTVATAAGRRMAGADQIDVLIPGVGGHGSAPQLAKDPVVMGARAVMDYQTIVSRQTDPQEPAVLTVGAFQSGGANNVIPSSATLKVNLRWFDSKTRQTMIDAIKRMTDAVAVSAGMAPDKMPSYTMKGHANPVVNDASAVARALPALRAALGPANVLPGGGPVMGSEDFAALASPYPDTKILFVMEGGGPATVFEDYKRGISPPANHSPHFKIDPAAIKPAVVANAMVLMEFLRP